MNTSDILRNISSCISLLNDVREKDDIARSSKTWELVIYTLKILLNKVISRRI